MLTNPTYWLFAAVAIPVWGATGACLGLIYGNSVYRRLAVRSGLLGGCACGGVLAYLLWRVTEEPLTIQLPLWTWISAPGAPPFSIVFGLQATWIKACLACFVGVWSLVSVSSSSRRTRDLTGARPEVLDAPQAQAQRVMVLNEALISLLEVAAIFLLFAPHIVQAFLAWCAVSILLLRIIRRSPDLGGTIDSTAPNLNSAQRSSSSPPGVLVLLLKVAALGPLLVERASMAAWLRLTQLPGWLGEQLEVLETSPVSFQLLATVLGTVAVLLTWLVAA